MKYQDFVIKNGKFIGQFEKMYQLFKDPWNLIKSNKKNYGLNYKLIFTSCVDIKKEIKKNKIKVLEVGCGYPQVTNELKKRGFDSYGIDISPTVIKKGKKKYPNLKNKLFQSDIDNKKLFNNIKADIYVLSDISWYILPRIKNFIKQIKKIKKNTFLIHSLTLYDGGVQEYGKSYFYNLRTIKKYFDLNYIYSCKVEIKKKRKYAFFVAKIS